ncbi:MAG: T9SS type A sorting domain-containing protein [Flavipsychrobacter sp.]
MKKMLLLPMLLAGTMFAAAQTNPNLIDFEPSTANLNGCGNYSQAEGALLNNNFFQCAYGVTFHMGSLGGTAPTVAQVGAPTVAWASATTYSYTSASQGCSVATSVSSDKPTNNKDVGCFFITDDPNGPGQNPAPLYVDYHDLECTEASGFLMDVDGTNNVQEGWQITAYGIGGSIQTVYVLSLQYNLYQPPPSPQVNIVAGDGEASYWGVNLGTDPIDYIEFRYIGHPSRSVGLAFDEFAICSSQPQITDTRGCCDDIGEDNLIVNGSFEGGNFGFTSPGYTYQGSFGPNSISEGMYSVVSSAQASSVSNCWNIMDHTFCTDGQGHYMVVNGRTHNPQSTMVYQQKDIPVEAGEEYIFCMYYQHLPQCAFDVFDPNRMFVSLGDADLTEGECDNDEEHCGWTKITYTVIPNGNTLDLTIFLDEGGIGDGNDVAFDDFSLRKKGVMPSDYCAFDISSSTSGSNITLTATAVTNPLPAGFNVEWNVVEASCNGLWTPVAGTSMTYAWNPYNTNFPGYCCVPGSATPGAFSTSKCYIITRKVTNCCYNDCEYKYYLSAQPQGMVMGKQAGTEEGTTFYISTDLKNWEPIANTSAAATKDLTIYPNPGDGKVTLTSRQPLEGSELTIYNVESKVVLRKTIESNSTAIDISKLPNGVYTFKVTDEAGNASTKNYVKQ